MSESRLAQEIIGLSNANIWEKAKLEWILDNVEYKEESETCLCGHFPINEICVLVNKQNGNTTRYDLTIL
jgi:hypothetical protein